MNDGAVMNRVPMIIDRRTTDSPPMCEGGRQANQQSSLVIPRRALVAFALA